MKKVITYGTFDLFHYGHLKLLERAKSFGDFLIVAVSTDEFNKQKGKMSVFPYEHRKAIVENIKFVDLVIPEDNWEQKVDDIKKYNVDILVMGDDWKGKFDYLKEICDVIYIPRTPVVSSTQLKSLISNLESIREFMSSLEKLDSSKLMDIINFLESVKKIT